METLNLPAVKFNLYQEEGQTYIFDTFRQKHVVLTPEEWVRQHVAHFLVNERGYTPGMIGIEVGIKYNDQIKRADIVVYNRQARPEIVIECKAPAVKITQKVFEQAGVYNAIFNAPILMVTNGVDHFISRVNFQSGEISFLDDIPFSV